MKTFKFIIIILLASISLVTTHSSASAERPKQWSSTGYYSANWVPDSQRIIYFKQISNYRSLNLSWYEDITEKMDYEPTGSTIYLCTNNFDGTDEKVIKEFHMPGGWDAPGSFMLDNLEWSKANNQISYSLKYTSGKIEEITGGWFYIINPDGSEVRKICIEEDGYSDHKFRWSPDGRTILYEIHALIPSYSDAEYLKKYERMPQKAIEYVVPRRIKKDTLYLMDADGENKRKLAEDARDGVWYPDGKKILISVHNKGSYLINIEDGSREKFIPRGGYSKNSNIYYGYIDGNLVKVEGVHTQDNSSFGPFYYDEDGKMRSFNIPGSPHLSPDGTKVIGVKAEGIVVLDLNNISEKIITGK